MKTLFAGLGLKDRLSAAKNGIFYLDDLSRKMNKVMPGGLSARTASRWATDCRYNDSSKQRTAQKVIFRGTIKANEWHSTKVDYFADTWISAGARFYPPDAVERFQFVIPPTSGAELRGSCATNRDPAGAGAAGYESGLQASIYDP
jgi:hypothetical protein